MLDASYLREKARHCRNMAKIAINPDLRAELIKFAEQFDRDAAKLDSAMAGDPPADAEGA
jgi:hypothetical protein